MNESQNATTYKLAANTPEECLNAIKLWIEACLTNVRDIGRATEELIAPIYESQLTILRQTVIVPKEDNELPSDL